MRGAALTTVVLAVLCGLLSGCTTAARTGTGGTCDLDGLPPQATETVHRIESGGPFPYPRNDGVVFGNYEGRLPQHERGYYHEYTVPTPGQPHRGTRRIITGGTPLTDPAEFYYTGDHYASFCLIGGV
ncbi:guanyl-specific ribonuclease Sa [Mycolicibacterium canariasense]|uniref:Ribonuclease n=2 Tax=Mycolicibacterium TaxID=1866885 RepID=W9BLB2_MYCCO|nr:guanyl-specific ribonuclease Sa [Mycolicibacterium canariasense]CDO09345.1 ribonuclease [Mycolicibacterium cosmeticum]